MENPSMILILYILPATVKQITSL